MNTSEPNYSSDRNRLWIILSLPMILFWLIPILALIARVSPSMMIDALRDDQAIAAIRTSLWTSSITTLITILLGTPLAYLIARRGFRHRRLLDTLIDLPTVLPPAVAGVALLIAFGRRGWIGSAFDDLGWSISFTPMAVVLAQMFVAAPFYIKSASIGFSTVDQELQQAAQLDGANTTQVLRSIILPLSWTSILGGSVMTWARAMGEFGATIIFAGNFPGRTQTMPLAIYLGFEMNLNTALTLSAILIGTSFIVLLIVKGLLNRE